jgi:hypothetical protein
MASVAILDISKGTTGQIKSKSYPKTKIIYSTTLTRIDEVLPFRVRFQNIGISVGNAGIPGIGLQIIGINNYIL